MAAKKSYVQAKRGFTCNPGGEVTYVPRAERIRDGQSGEEVDLTPATAALVKRYPEWYDPIDANPTIVSIGDVLEADDPVVKGREALFEELGPGS
jgi:hypothetical protein